MGKAGQGAAGWKGVGGGVPRPADDFYNFYGFFLSVHAIRLPIKLCVRPRSHQEHEGKASFSSMGK